jgi:hypothetical protein
MCIAESATDESRDVRIDDTLDAPKNEWKAVSIGDSFDESSGIIDDE